MGVGDGVAGTVREYAGGGGTVQASLPAIVRRVPCSRGVPRWDAASLQAVASERRRARVVPRSASHLSRYVA